MKPLPKNIQAWINEELSGHTIAAHTSKSDFPCHYEIAQRRMAHHLLEVIEMQREALEKIKQKSIEGVDNLDESDAKLSACYVLAKQAIKAYSNEKSEQPSEGSE